MFLSPKDANFWRRLAKGMQYAFVHGPIQGVLNLS